MTENTPASERWEEEVVARHRWGRDEDRAAAEHTRLRELWNAAQPVSDGTPRITDQIVALEICNWKLEASIVALCEAIGAGRPAEMAIGHEASITDERWCQVWQYYAALRDWPARGRAGGYATLVARLDPSEEVQKHVADMLGDPDEVKELYAERLCLCLERWMQHWLPADPLRLCGHRAAVAAVEEEIRRRDPDPQILAAMRDDGDGLLQACSHKAFRRYDILISSIGRGEWRGGIRAAGTDGSERADLIASYLDPIDAWLAKGQEAHIQSQLGRKLTALLGEPDDTKRFLASLLVSLLRAQEATTRERAKS